MNSKRTLIILTTLFAVISWGASFIATKIALRYVQPFTVVWVRFGIGVVILGIAAIARGQIRQRPAANDLLYFALLGAQGITFHQWLQSSGLVTSQATSTAWIVATTPVFIALLGWIFLKERFAVLRWAGILLAALGVLLVVAHGDLSSIFRGGFGEPGDLLILISAPNWAIFTILSRRGLSCYPAALMMLYVMVFGWLFTSIFFFSGPGLADLARLRLDGILALLFLGIFCSGLAYIFWYDALQALPAAQVGAFLYLEPLITVLVAGTILLEPLYWSTLIGGVIILAGVWLVNRPAQRAGA